MARSAELVIPHKIALKDTGLQPNNGETFQEAPPSKALVRTRRHASMGALLEPGFTSRHGNVPLVSVRHRGPGSDGRNSHSRSLTGDRRNEYGSHQVPDGNRHFGSGREGSPPHDGEAGREDNGEHNEKLLGPSYDFQTPYFRAVELLDYDAVHNRSRGENDRSERKSVLCIDGGLVSPTPTAIRVAGPVGLYAQTFQVLTAKIASGEIRIDSIFNHDECGAAGLEQDAQDTTLSRDNVGKILATRLAGKLTAVSAFHDTVRYGKKLPLERRPSGKHTEQVIIVDGRKHGLDPSWIRELPPAFVISRGIMGPDATRDYTNLAIDIAFGNSGLGNRLQKGTPLHLLGIVGSQGQEGQLIDELRLIQKARGLDAGRIKVNIIPAPSKPRY